MKCPYKFSNYEFEGGQECIGIECGMHNLCNADDEITAVEFDALDEHAQALERENEELQAKVDEYENKSEICTLLSDGKIYTGSKALTERIAELQAKVDELTEDYKASSNGLEILTLKNAELQTQVNNLNSENAKLSSELAAARNAHAQAEYDNATLRDKLGRMLDCSHEIERIGQI